MTFFDRFKNFFVHQEVQVWDTSAISAWLDILIKTVKEGKTTVVITEGVMHEISAGRHKYENVRRAYKFLINCKDITIDITSDEHKAWTYDEQVIATVQKYKKAGYDVSLVTCDHDQAFKAKIRKLKYKILKGSKEDNSKIETKNESKIYPVKEVEKSREKVIENNDEILIPQITHGKRKYINARDGVVVLDSKGKRRIASNNLIPYERLDQFYYNDKKYQIKESTDTTLTLIKVKV